MLRRALLVVVLDAFLGANTAAWPPAMIACTVFGDVPKVGGISDASTTPSRPLVPAPTKITRPPLCSACAMISTPWGDPFLFFMDSRQHLAVFVDHLSTMSRSVILVERRD